MGAVQLKQTSTYGYDALDRLVSAEASGAGAWGAYEREYTYNAIGNLTARSYDPVHEEVTYSYPASGENSVRPHAVSSTSEEGSFGYDANGNTCAER